MKKLYTISVFTENSPGVLQRVTILFTKRKVNIESLTVSDTERDNISRFTIVIKAEPALVDIIVAQLRRVIEVQEAFASSNEELLFKEIAFIRVRTEAPEQGKQIEEVALRHGAKLALVKKDSVVVEVSGDEDEIGSLCELLRPYGIAEFVRSGRIALRKDLTR